MSQQEDANLLRQQAQKWATLVVKLHNTQVPAELETEKRALINFAKKIKEAVEGVVGTVPELDPMNQLGFIPIVVGVVGVAGAAAAITKWTYDYKKFMTKIAERDKLIAGGLSPEQAANVVNRAESPSMFQFNGTKTFTVLGLAALGLWFAKKEGYL